MTAAEQLIEQGRVKGLKEGKQQGMQQGMQRGVLQGIQQGVRQSLIQVALEMLKNDQSVEMVVRCVNLSKDEVVQLQTSLSNENNALCEN